MVGVYSKANVFTEKWDKDFFTHSMRRSVRPYLRVGFVLSIYLSIYLATLRYCNIVM